MSKPTLRQRLDTVLKDEVLAHFIICHALCDMGNINPENKMKELVTDEEWDRVLKKLLAVATS